MSARGGSAGAAGATGADGRAGPARAGGWAGAPRPEGGRGGAAAALAALLAALLWGPGCISLHKGDIYRDDRDTVFVSYFSNETFYKDVEFDLTEDVVAEILSSPGLKLSSKDEAEVLLSGRILDIQQRVLSEDPQQVPTSTNTTVTVEVQLIDARTGTVLEKRKLSGRGQSVPGRNEDLAFARQEAFRFLARDIVRMFEEEF